MAIGARGATPCLRAPWAQPCAGLVGSPAQDVARIAAGLLRAGQAGGRPGDPLRATVGPAIPAGRTRCDPVSAGAPSHAPVTCNWARQRQAIRASAETPTPARYFSKRSQLNEGDAPQGGSRRTLMTFSARGRRAIPRQGGRTPAESACAAPSARELSQSRTGAAASGGGIAASSALAKPRRYPGPIPFRKCIKDKE